MKNDNTKLSTMSKIHKKKYKIKAEQHLLIDQRLSDRS